MKTPRRVSPRHLAAARENLRKARAALKAVNYQTPRRRAASQANVRKAQLANISHFRMTPRRLAASRANIRKAWAAPKRTYRRTPERLAIARANLRRAWAANRGNYRRTPGRLEANRGNALRHGFYSVSLEDTLARLHEDPKEFEAHLQLVARVFAPQDETEQKIVRRLAEAIWLHLRLFRAQGRWEADALHHFLSLAPECTPLSPDLTLARGYSLRLILLDQDKYHRVSLQVLGRIESAIGKLVRKRTGGRQQFDSLARRILRSIRESDKREAQREAVNRVLEGGPEAERIFREVESQLKEAKSQ